MSAHQQIALRYLGNPSSGVIWMTCGLRSINELLFIPDDSARTQLEHPREGPVVDEGLTPSS